MIKNVGKRVLSGIMSFTMAVSVLAGVSFIRKVNAAEEIVLHNPVVDMDAMCAGQKVTWDCVWFGSYPQTEVKAGDSEYEALQSAEGWDDNGDIVINNNVVNGTKYRRMVKGDATFAKSGDGHYYDWEDDTTYHYFRYEPVKWRVLKTDGSNAMLLSDIVLDDRKYNEKYKDTTWETSTIRSWLNGYDGDVNQAGTDYSSSNFINSVFTTKEQSAIADTNIVNNDNRVFHTKGGNDTVDKLFLLSEAEVYTDTASVYGFAQGEETDDEARRCKSSDYAKAMGVWNNGAAEGGCSWWLRSPGIYGNNAATVDIIGYIYGHGNTHIHGSYVDCGGNGVRVALNLNLSLSNLYAYAGIVSSDGIIEESGKAEENISNPRIVKVTDAQKEQNVKWDCVYFGNYPQTEVKDTDSEYAVLQSAEDWDGNGDTVINETKYHRMQKGDATYTGMGSGYYNWEDDTAYHYFRYEPVKWRVLKTDGSNAMLLSDIVLDDRKYNMELKSTTWETSTIRSWLNGYNADMNQEGINYSSSNFIDSAFTTEEQSAIADTNVVNNDSLEYGTKGGNDTIDKLFLLSESEIYTKEAKAYGFSKDRFVFDISRISKSSDYAKAMGVFSGILTNYKGNCSWWLRSPGSSGSYGSDAACVYSYGYVHNYGINVDGNDYGVRVALNLNLSSSNLYTYAGTVCSDEIVDVTEEPSTEEQTTEEPSTEEATTEKTSSEKTTTEQPPAKKTQTIKVTKSYIKTYGAKPFKLNEKLTKGNGTLKYTTSNKNIAVVDKSGKVTIKGTGICTVTVTASATDTYKATSAKITITVKPKKNTVTKVKLAGSRILNVTWKKDTKGAGYKLQYSATKNFPSKTTVTVNIGKNKTTSYKIRKLAKGKKYYIRIRTYQNVKVNGKTKKLYGDWSAVKQSGKIK